MPSTIARKKYGTDINRYLGVEYPEDRIQIPQHSSRTPRPSVKRGTSSAFSFRGSPANMFSSGNDASNRQSTQSSTVRRWRSKSVASGITPETPLRDRTETMKTTTPASINNTTFLPELHSTPPMPTFQKSTVMTPRSPAPRPAGLSSSNSSARRDKPLPPIGDLGRMLSSSGTKVGPALVDRVEDTPPLPGGWTPQHDLAICVLDARNYSLPGIVAKVRRTFPSLKGILTTAMIDKRLRQLDQDIEIDYWRVGLRSAKDSVVAVASVPRLESALAEKDKENVAGPSRTKEGKGKAPASLIKAQSVSNMLPDSVSFSSGGPGTPTPGAMTHEFFGGYRTNAI
ncbi:hypothetical protein LTS10_010687 [Elasticomyces elasticus]|nr:hypothetical protein LTS10_010687 [Elasticomyces elasticus]